MLRLIVSLLLCVHIATDSKISSDCRIIAKKLYLPTDKTTFLPGPPKPPGMPAMPGGPIAPVLPAGPGNPGPPG